MMSEAVKPNAADVPTGFLPHTRRSPATSAWEPIYFRVIDESYQLAIRFADAHANTRGGLHGGVIATLADNAMGLTLSLALKGRTAGLVTTSLSIDYIAAATPGQWIVFVPRLIRSGRANGVVDALVYAADKAIARTNASFRILV